MSMTLCALDLGAQRNKINAKAPLPSKRKPGGAI